MTIYLDLVIFINFAFDFILLLVVNIVLKRNAKLRRIFFGSVVGGLSILTLFLPLTSLTLFLLKVAMSIVMILVTFGYKDLKYFLNNFIHLYIVSILLGGFLYYMNLEFSYKQVGMVFINNKMSINYILLLILSPIVLIIYIKQNKNIKFANEYYYLIRIVFKNNKELNLNAFLDSGNRLKDPITKKSVILVPEHLLRSVIRVRSPILVPYTSLNNHGLLKCISPKYIEINGRINNNLLIGISEEKFNMDGVQCIINTDIMEDLK